MDIGTVPLKPNGGPRNAHAYVDLGANRDILDEVAEHVGQPALTGVAAVPANLLTDYAARDSKHYRASVHGGNLNRCHLLKHARTNT